MTEQCKIVNMATKQKLLFRLADIGLADQISGVSRLERNGFKISRRSGHAQK
jgi:hypothetical protein